jgi:glycosyltransferase involved in cell wall biosynthesis
MKLSSEYHPLVSIIIPVKNGGATLDACLRSIRRSYYKHHEVIVVDDSSDDTTVAIAKEYDCTVLQLTDGHGANSARNFGASHAKGDILMFLDADIVVARETLLGVVETLEENFNDAVVGMYTAKHRHVSFVSQYKNLWVRYSYIKSNPAIDWLFGAISGIKRQAFEKLGGFNVDLRAKDGHDDIELGKRFARANLNIVLNMDIEVEHLKEYTFVSFVKNEFRRSLAFAELATRFGETAQSLRKGFVNVYPAFILSTICSMIILLMLSASIGGYLSYWYPVGSAGIYLLMNIRFLNYLEQVRGLFAMIAMIPFLFIDHVVCCTGSVIGILRGITKKN